jgi:hypothetical protein
VVKQHEIDSRFQKVDILEQGGTDQRVAAYFLLKINGEAGFPIGENTITQCQLAHIMEIIHRCPRCGFLPLKSQSPARRMA